MNRFTKIHDFAEARARGVGSSDIPTLALLNLKFGSSPLTLWREKTGRDEGFKGNDRTYWGRRLEGLVLREYVNRRERENPSDKERYLAAGVAESDLVEIADGNADYFYRNYLRGKSFGPYKVNTECFHPDYSFALAHADLVIPDEQGGGRIQEAKTHGLHAARRAEEDPDKGYDEKDRSQNGVPASVFLQVQWQLFCYGVAEAGVSALIDTSDYREYSPIVADPRTQEKLLALAERFWWHVQHDQEPKPETWKDVQLLYPDQQDTTTMISGEDEMRVLEMIDRKKALEAKIKRSEAEIEEMKNAVGILVGLNSVLTNAEGKVLAKSYQRKREFLSMPKDLPEVEAAIRAAGLVKESKWRELRF